MKRFKMEISDLDNNVLTAYQGELSIDLPSEFKVRLEFLFDEQSSTEKITETA